MTVSPRNSTPIPQIVRLRPGKGAWKGYRVCRPVVFRPSVWREEQRGHTHGKDATLYGHAVTRVIWGE